MGEIVNIKEKRFLNYIQKSKETLQGMPIDIVIEALMTQLLDEVKSGLEGDIGYDKSPFFAAVDQEYEKARVKGCYFCDRTIDPMAVPYEPGKTKVCLTCNMKIRNFLNSIQNIKNWKGESK